MSELNIWDISKNILKHKAFIPWTEIEKLYKAFIINRIFMSDPELVQLVNVFNTSRDIPKEIQYAILMQYVKKTHRFMKFPASAKSSEIINKIMEDLDVRQEIAQQLHTMGLA